MDRVFSTRPLFTVILLLGSFPVSLYVIYRVALGAAPDKGGTWLGLALSLENLGRRNDAADAYRRALATGTLTADVKQYAEQKVRQLR